MPNSGQTLAERYRLAQRIAVGGMGEVWQAVDVRLDRTVAVKILKPELCGDAEFLHRFRTEARTTASLNHPGIAAVHDYGETAAVPDGPEDTAYLVMEHVEGEPLAAILAKEGRITAEHTLEMLEQAGNALHAAHRRGLVHRDVKPGNILVTPDGTVKLTDFGIAKAADAAPVTRSGMVMGTAHYISPEQALGSEATPSSDVYSLAVVGYECLRGHRPFLSDNAVTVAMMHIRDMAPPLPPDVPPGTRALIEATLVKDPRMRYGEGGEFANAVASVRAGRPLPAPLALSSQPPPAPGPAGSGQPAPPQQVTPQQVTPQQVPPQQHGQPQQPMATPPPQHGGHPRTGTQHPTINQQQAVGHQQTGRHAFPNPPGSTPPPGGAPSGPPHPTGAQPSGTVPPGVIPPQAAPGSPPAGGNQYVPPAKKHRPGRGTTLWVVIVVVVLVLACGAAATLAYNHYLSLPAHGTDDETTGTVTLSESVRQNTTGRVRLADFASTGEFNTSSLRHPEGWLSHAPTSAISSWSSAARRKQPISSTTTHTTPGTAARGEIREAGTYGVGGTAHRTQTWTISAVTGFWGNLMGRSWTQIGTTQR
ncbi:MULTISPECIES: serine/threonine-protein kinase [Actinopolyspora]|uniref:non-specific serine/threonine protein kinase n=1 Tax=Actinopolyspora saharensis TaxID=995062 RepID=A0A1H1FMD2_9ACTN|nr:serine/threonine-protein kinase [Actinopolyspora saharensis]NHD18898.1 serine/threonine protein kinase [Actinopolyspora sp. BKK2]NHE77321.1 serine/threonine protein kinase [Actinopolyspora sp. BKK1]SDR02045.1 Serine/threonine protein kinase [Actinopolyspora saharensis]